MKLKFKNFLDKITPGPLFVVILFSLTFFSIPLFSFQPKLNFITWALTILLLTSMFLRLLKNGRVYFDLISLSCIGFIVSVFVSLSLNRFAGFVPTSIYLQLIILLFYTYFSSDTINKKQVLFGAYLATLIFSFIFAFKYRNEILSLSFDRLGEDFGDINDMAIFAGLGFTFGYYYFIASKKWYFKVFSLLSCLLFVFCGLCTGSKIVFFLIFVSFFLLTLMAFGKKQWYFSLALIVLFIALGALLFTVPAFSTIKTRLLEMISTLLGRSIGGVNANDGSTIGRFEMFLGGIQMFFRKPLFGWGPWGFATFGGFGYAWSHNNISESLCNFGLVGSILFHFGLGISIVNFLKSHSKKNLALPFSLIIFFIVMMLGVALNSQKIYAYLLPVLLSMIVDKQPYRFSFNLRSKKMNEEVSLNDVSYSERKTRLVEVIPSLKLRGGAEVFCTSLCREIIAQGNVDLKIIVLHSDLHETFKDLAPYIVFCGKKKKIDLKAARELKKQILSFKPDFVHTHLSCLVTYLLALGFKNREFEYFHTVHNVPKKESGFVQRQLNKFFFRFKTRHLVGISDRITGECRKIYKDIDIKTIYNGFKIESKQPIKKEKKEYDLVCVARFSPQKNHNFLIEAFSILKKEYPKLKLICVGGGELLDQIKQKTKELGLTSSVTFTGYVNDVSNFLRDSKYFVLTSKHEGNPISILEAYHFGLPVISSSVGGVPDVVNSKTGILFEPNSISSFIDSFIKIALSNYEELSNNCVEVSEKYSISKCVDQYLDSFRKSRAYFENKKIESNDTKF